MFGLKSARRFVVPLTVAMTVLISAPSAWASPPSKPPKPVTSHTKGPIHWTLPSAGCTLITSDLTGDSKIEDESATTTWPDGSQHVVDKSQAEGAAVDGNGVKYHFHYKNTTILDIPAGGSPVLVHMMDEFRVEGKGHNHGDLLHSAFDWSWTFTPPAANWPPVDNWIQNYTLGDSLNCDPI